MKDKMTKNKKSSVQMTVFRNHVKHNTIQHFAKTKRPLQQENNASTKSFISANAILKVGNTISFSAATYKAGNFF